MGMTRDCSTLMVAQYFKRRREFVEIFIVSGSGLGIAVMSSFIKGAIRYCIDRGRTLNADTLTERTTLHHLFNPSLADCFFFFGLNGILSATTTHGQSLQHLCAMRNRVTGFSNHRDSFQRDRLATRTAAGHRDGVHDVPVGHVLPVGVAVPPAETGHPSSEEPKAKDQRQEPARRSAAVPGLYHAPQQDRPYPARVHRHQRFRHQHSNILSGRCNVITNDFFFFSLTPYTMFFKTCRTRVSNN